MVALHGGAPSSRTHGGHAPAEQPAAAGPRATATGGPDDASVGTSRLPLPPDRPFSDGGVRSYVALMYDNRHGLFMARARRPLYALVARKLGRLKLADVPKAAGPQKSTHLLLPSVRLQASTAAAIAAEGPGQARRTLIAAASAACYARLAAEYRSEGDLWAAVLRHVAARRSPKGMRRHGASASEAEAKDWLRRHLLGRGRGTAGSCSPHRRGISDVHTGKHGGGTHACSLVLGHTTGGGGEEAWEGEGGCDSRCCCGRVNRKGGGCLPQRAARRCTWIPCGHGRALSMHTGPPSAGCQLPCCCWTPLLTQRALFLPSPFTRRFAALMRVRGLRRGSARLSSRPQGQEAPHGGAAAAQRRSSRCCCITPSAA